MKKRPIRKLGDIAVGSFEAAAVMGVHWTQPAVMSRKGTLRSKTLKMGGDSDGSRVFQVYSLADCERDYEEYEEAVAQHARRRPRANLDARPEGLRKLNAVEQHIEFDDAIGIHEASQILGCHWTFPPRLVRSEKIVGRLLHNGRADKGVADRLWIFSRRSCEQNARETRALAKAGKKPGRPRSALS